ncbi:hypothetical protein ACFE04_007773 [Oxalis oulophora]
MPASAWTQVDSISSNSSTTSSALKSWNRSHGFHKPPRSCPSSSNPILAAAAVFALSAEDRADFVNALKVDINSLEQYISFVVDASVKSGIVGQMEALRAGFKSGEFTQEQHRSFCLFVTGAPRLPHGGLAVLKPKLTIVRKVRSASFVHPLLSSCFEFILMKLGYKPSTVDSNDDLIRPFVSIGFYSVAQTLLLLSNNIDNALQGARDLAKPPTLTEIFNSKVTNAEEIRRSNKLQA